MSPDQRPTQRGRRSSSRPISAPKVPVGGPLRELKKLLHQLYVEAGSRPYQVIETWMKGRALELGKTAIGRYLTDPVLPPDQSATITLAAVLAANGPRDVEDVRAQVRQLWLAAHDWTPLGVPIEDLKNPIALEVHEAIKVPGSDGLPVLPPYLQREHDHELRGRIARAVAEGRSAMVVLVGGSSTGKTRACWEAIHGEVAGDKLLAGWRVWHPYDPTRPEAALDVLERVESRTVVWLNETQLYLLTGGSDQGQRVVARLRRLLADDERAPVLVLGTMWPEYWHTLTRRHSRWRTGPARASAGAARRHVHRRSEVIRPNCCRRAESVEQ